MYPNVIKKLINNFKDFPGVGDKSAERLAFSLINFDDEQLENFSNVIIEVKEKISKVIILYDDSEFITKITINGKIFKIILFN